MQITGTTSSRLNELRKYTINNDFNRQYFTGGTININGVDLNNSNPLDKITYYIDGIKYIDIISGTSSGITYNYYLPLGLTEENSINNYYYKNPNKDNIISAPKVNDDVFISRQELTAFDKNYRLEYIKNLTDLLTYAGGSFFKIYKNS